MYVSLAFFFGLVIPINEEFKKVLDPRHVKLTFHWSIESIQVEPFQLKERKHSQQFFLVIKTLIQVLAKSETNYLPLDTADISKSLMRWKLNSQDYK